MFSSFVEFPAIIDSVISALLSSQDTASWVKRAKLLHNRYLLREKEDKYLHDFLDALAYLALRAPSTYTQAFAAFSSLSEVSPAFKPVSILDVGSGSGVSLWAAQRVWPSLTTATAIDQDKNVLSLGREIATKANMSLNVEWIQQDIRKGVPGNNMYDMVVLANVLNELPVSEAEKVLGSAYNACKGVLIVIEPGTPFGSSIVSSVAQKLGGAGNILAPYIDNTFVANNSYWLHFSQRFTRPEFERRVRQHMRDSNLMASDWEDTKFAYVAIGKIPIMNKAWGRCVGPINKQKGFLEIPILTREALTTIKVMKRNKELYNFAKDLKWGQLIEDKKLIVQEE